MYTKRMVGAVGALALSAGVVLALSNPAAAADELFPDGGWQVRDYDGGWVDTAESAIVDPTTVELTKPAGDIGSSIETAHLGIPVSAGDEVTVNYELQNGAAIDAGAVRLFLYSHAEADTLTEAPTAFVAADGSGSLTITVGYDGAIGSLGLTYDASNDSAGTVRFSDLTVGDTTVLFVEPPEPTPSATATPDPTPTTTAEPEETEQPVASGGGSNESLPVTGSDWVRTAAVVAGAAVLIGVVALVAVRRKRTVFRA